MKKEYKIASGLVLVYLILGIIWILFIGESLKDGLFFIISSILLYGIFSIISFFTLRSEKELKESELRYRLAVHETDDVVWNWDLKTGTIKIGGALTRLFGYLPEEIKDINWWFNNLHPDDKERVTKTLKEAVEGNQKVWEENYRFRKNDGGYLDVLGRGWITRNSLGSAVGMICVMRDVTELIQEKLRQERALLLSIISAMGEGLLLVNNDFKIELANETAAKLLNTSIDRLQNQDIRKTLKFFKQNKITPFEDTPIIDSLRQRKNTKITLSDNFYLQIDNSNELPVSIISSPLIYDSKLAAVIVFNDLTYEKNLEKSRVGFISIASHQLRTPLSAIRWSAEMLLHGDLGELPNEQHDFVKNIHSSTKRLIDLVSILLIYSRLETGEVSFEPVPLDLVDAVNGIILESAPLIKKRGLKVDVDVRLDRVPQINLELEVFRQVMMNLIVNAIHYNKEGGEIKIVFDKKDSEIIIAVRDTGIGIPEDSKNKIFEKFFRAPNAVSAFTEGTGLGLSLSKVLTSLWDGDIWFESEENKGSTFYVSIPLKGMEPRKGRVKLTA